MTVLQVVGFWFVEFNPEFLEWWPETLARPTGGYIDLQSARRLAAVHNAKERLFPTGIWLEVDIRWNRLVEIHYAHMN